MQESRKEHEMTAFPAKADANEPPGAPIPGLDKAFMDEGRFGTAGVKSDEAKSDEKEDEDCCGLLGEEDEELLRVEEAAREGDEVTADPGRSQGFGGDGRDMAGNAERLPMGDRGNGPEMQLQMSGDEHEDVQAIAIL
ncbi:hypothetical protein HK101_009689 [Irineochytrium annulatum]|nr:hypothetical protein HK101_009689 [Irineochytrium annulatum]